jgi:prepilin-type N-terminal cleavage/methylation domain-containing protein
MTLGQKCGGSRRSGCHGFTLIEILLVLALLSLLVSLFIAGTSDLFRDQEKTMDDIFWQAVQAARLQAVEGDQTVELRYDEKMNQVRWGAAAATANLPWPGKSLEFLPVEKRDTMLIGGQLIETGKMEAVKFYADGSVENFRAQLTGNDGRLTHLDIDPWTCAAIIHQTH